MSSKLSVVVSHAVACIFMLIKQRRRCRYGDLQTSNTEDWSKTTKRGVDLEQSESSTLPAQAKKEKYENEARGSSWLSFDGCQAPGCCIRINHSPDGGI